MNILKNILGYTVLAGGGSVALSFFIDAYFQDIAIMLLMVASIIIAVYDVFTSGESAIRVQFTSIRRPEEAGMDASKDEKSGIYYALGVIVFGSVILVL
mgnify:CR=1 FL=1